MKNKSLTRLVHHSHYANSEESKRFGLKNNGLTGRKPSTWIALVIMTMTLFAVESCAGPLDDETLTESVKPSSPTEGVGSDADLDAGFDESDENTNSEENNTDNDQDNNRQEQSDSEIPSEDSNPSNNDNSTQKKLFVGYFQSWSETWQATGAKTTLANLPSYINVVNLSFMYPDATYVKGSYSLNGTGLGFPYDGPTLRDAITELHKKQPNTKVMVSIGGATYTNWSNFSAKSIADFVADFDLDGVDIDYEPSYPNCTTDSTKVTCPSSDTQYVNVIKSMRNVLPREKWLSMAAWSVGAYGEGEWANAQPISDYTGIALAVFNDAQASAALDLVNVMSYDAGLSYEPLQALKAFQYYFKGRIAMGIEVPPEAWGGHETTPEEIDILAKAVQQNNAAGLMLWSIQKQGPAQLFATRICEDLGLSDCDQPMY